MGEPHVPVPALLVVAATSRYAAALEWGLTRIVETYGPVAMSSPAFEFTETEYYAQAMGDGLKKQLWALAEPVDPGQLAAIKLQTNLWEQQYAALGDHPESRPLNLDPGYMTLAKLVLASTKDHAHRIYLADGIYAEVTLAYRAGGWQPQAWTYPDYRRADYQAFFAACRQRLRGLER
ncbi:MAG TPA: DUF4416 family protein [Lacipirellulaceae bacterium]|nr:DUF4416 family protein [Lacipirellulaceae bacterium]